MAHETRGDSVSGHSTAAFSMGMRNGSVCSCTRKSRSTSPARNAVTMLWPDAAQTRVRKGSIGLGPDAMRFGPHTLRLLRAALGTGIDARPSRNAGSYLCNYLSWRAIEAVCTDDHLRLRVRKSGGEFGDDARGRDSRHLAAGILGEPHVAVAAGS